MKPLGAATGESEFSATAVVDRSTSAVTTGTPRARQDEFREKICVLVGDTPHFESQQVGDVVEVPATELVNFPWRLPDLNPVTECWRQ